MSFIPRISSSFPTEMQDNPWWYSRGNIYYPNYGLPNCTCYVYGRAAEVQSAWQQLPEMDAKKWYDDLVDSGLYPYGGQPKLGGIMCYAPLAIDPDDPDDPSNVYGGHVSFVEEVELDDNNNIVSILTSNSAWQGTYFWTERVYARDAFLASWMGMPRNYYYQGCVYVTPENVVYGGRKKGLPIWMMLRYV